METVQYKKKDIKTGNFFYTLALLFTRKVRLSLT